MNEAKLAALAIIDREIQDAREDHHILCEQVQKMMDDGVDVSSERIRKRKDEIGKTWSLIAKLVAIRSEIERYA